MSTAPAKSASGASQLQRKIFTRWVNQKLGSRKMKVEDCVTGLGTGLELVAMLEVLSEKTCPKQLKKLDAKSPPIQKVDNLQHALKFMYDCGVVLELKPSAENFVDGEEKSILGAVWGIMKTFLKFGDDDENKMNAVDALKMWAVNQTHGYKGVNIQDFTKSWHDGLAFCALIHKHRPKLIGDFDKLNPKEDEKNIKIAMAAAEKFFQLEQFLQPGDIKKLDDKSMVIYVSEFYYGIAAQRKVDLAARRIGKLIQFTQINDKMRAEYQSRAESMKKGLDKVMVHLRDRTIDNTMAGAKKRLDQFVEYREKDKAGIVGDFLSIESLYNQLSLRLSDRKRPMYNPPQGLDLGGLRSALAELEKCEQERKVALHAELNRQIKLANLNEQHTTRSGAITSWGKEKAVFVGKTETIESVGAAEYHLNALKAFNNESAALQAGSFVEIKKLGKYLLDEKFEHGKDVQAREATLDSLFKQLNEQSAAKQQVLDDALAREKYKVQVRGWAQVHSDKHKKLAGWQQEKKEYLEAEEKINAIDEAELALSLLNAYDAESASLLPAAVPAFKAVGKKVIDAKYETKFSQWKFETPEDVTSREENVDSTTQTLAQLSQKKRKKLDDDLAREKYKALVRTWNGNHINTQKQIADWVQESTEYLNKAETITNIPTAQAALSALDVWESDKTDVTNINVKSLRGYGNQILTAEYKGLTQWKWEKPEDVQKREAWVDEQWQVLSGLSAQKKAVLEKALALEIKKEQLRLAFANQAGDYVLWAKEAADNAGQTHFGFTLEEVESYDAKGNDKKAQDASASKTQAWKATWDEMTSHDVKENVYTQLTPSHLEKAANDLTSALEERAGRYAAELKRQRDNDALCREFAGLAEPLVKQIDADRDTIAKSSADLEKQLAFVEERLKLAASNEKLDAIKEVQEKMDKAGIKNNPHSAQTARDCEVQWKQYQAFLNTKKTSLAEQIEQKKLRGVTPDQMAEIQQQFTQFDKDKSGAIDGKELRACLYSLGYERGSKEVKAIMDEFGKDDAKHAGGKVMIYDGFKEFMIRQLGDSETKEEMLAGFELVSRGTPAGNNEHSDTVLAESDVAYLKVNAPKAGSNPDYKAWILAALAR